MSYSRQGLTEECPLTKDKGGYKLSDCCGGGLKFIVSCFIVLSFAITATLILQLLYANNLPQDRITIHGAVATDYTNCSQIGTMILRKGGNAVDAAVAATMCMTVVAPYKTSLGGSGCIMIYNHRDQSNPSIIDFASNTAGVLEEQIPAVLKGLEFAQTLYGRLPWHDVIEPSAKLARTGFVVTKEFAYEISKHSKYAAMYGHLDAGDILQLHTLADTLDAVMLHGSIVLYNGSLSYKMLYNDSLHEEQLKQLAEYEPQVITAAKSTFYRHAVYYPPHISSLKLLIGALENLHISSENASSIESQALVAQTLIYSDAIQNTEQERYTGVMVMDWQDIYVCILTGLNAPLFARMTDAGFLVDKTDTSNTLSTLIPVIFHNNEVVCGLRGVFGTDDPALVIQILYNLVVRELNVSVAIEYPRYYLLSDGIAIESDQNHAVSGMLREELSSITSVSHIDANLIQRSVNAIIKQKDSMTSHSDSRGGGLASRF